MAALLMDAKWADGRRARRARRQRRSHPIKTLKRDSLPPALWRELLLALDVSSSSERGFTLDSRGLLMKSRFVRDHPTIPNPRPILYSSVTTLFAIIHWNPTK